MVAFVLTDHLSIGLFSTGCFRFYLGENEIHLYFAYCHKTLCKTTSYQLVRNLIYLKPKPGFHLLFV